MRVRHSVPQLVSAALALLAAPMAFAAAQTRTNPPSACTAADSSCPCESGREVDAKCIKVSLDMGRGLKGQS